MKSALALPGILSAIKKSGLGEPEIGKTVYFTKGFESYNLYEVVVQNVKNRLLILGRKNRKLFDKNFGDFFERLPLLINKGFEFKCIFLDPDSPAHIIRAAHQNDNFPNELNISIKNAQKMLSMYNIDFRNHIKFYNIQRTTEIIIIDDAVLYSQIRIDSDGRALKLTKSHFRLTSIYTDDGKFNLNQFENFWNCSQTKNCERI